jgi:CheY-like chemotaxis protein
MAAPFSLEHIARVRDSARRLLMRATEQEGEIRKLLAAAEASIEGSRADDVAVARALCLAAREQTLAAERLVNDLGGSQRPSGEASLGIAVLVVDDYQDSREWLSVLLENAGFTVRTATNGLEAVIAAYELQPAVIVMDVMMPVLDGLEAARLIKAIDELRTPRMIAYTARTPEPQFGELFTAIMSKPSPPDVVVETVKRLAAAS